jgi:hypothetical protein
MLVLVRFYVVDYVPKFCVCASPKRAVLCETLGTLSTLWWLWVLFFVLVLTLFVAVGFRFVLRFHLFFAQSGYIFALP